jgi:hypothetical protein
MKATKAIIQARVDDILRIRLDGAEFWDVRQYVAEKEQAAEPPWAIPEGGNPISQRQLWRYIARADRLMGASSETTRKKQLRVHLARRKSLYARAVNKGDERTALAVLRDLAELQGLYGDEVTRQLEELRRRVERLTGDSNGDGDGNAGGAAGPGPDSGPAGGGTEGRPAADPPAGGPGGDLPGGADDAGCLAAEVAPLPLFPPPAAVQ